MTVAVNLQTLGLSVAFYSLDMCSPIVCNLHEIDKRPRSGLCRFHPRTDLENNEGLRKGADSCSEDSEELCVIVNPITCMVPPKLRSRV